MPPITIALAGKGSVGKSTLIPFLVRALTQRFPSARLLIVDADPHMSSSCLLQICPAETLGTLRSRYERELARGHGIQDESRVAFAERQMGEQAIVKAPGYDLLALGHWEPNGSQCTVNRVLERSFTQLAHRYDLILFDHEAGVEHMGRFAAIPLHLLLLMATPEPLSLAVAARILERRNEVSRQIEQTWLILNRVHEGDCDEPAYLQALQQLPVSKTVAHLPESLALRRIQRMLLSPLTLEPQEPWARAVADLCKRLTRQIERLQKTKREAA